MSPGEAGERTYDGDQVAAILRAAAELDQSRLGSGNVARSGLTLAEIQQIAGEVGISPASVQAASLQLPETPDSGFATRIQRVTTLPGDVSGDARERLADDVRAVMGARANVRRTASGLEIELEKSELGPLVVAIRCEEGATIVSLFSERDRSSGAAVTGSALGLFGSLGLAANAPGAAVMAAAGIAGVGVLMLGGAGLGLAAGVGIWRWNARTWRRRVDVLYARIVAAVAATVDAPARNLPPG